MQFEHNNIANIEQDSPVNQDTRANGRMRVSLGGGAIGAATASDSDSPEPNPYAGQNISRNALCPCGSGLKYKQCHGKI